MRFILYILLSALLLSCNKDNSSYDTNTESTTQTTIPTFVKGADISWVSEMEKDGKVFRMQNGTKADIFNALSSVGINAIRLRVWVNPQEGWSSKEDVLRLAERANKAGMLLMIDFHYSDFFADPSRQTIPTAWADATTDLSKMVQYVKNHTTDVLSALKSKGITPVWVQIGNETRNGMLWPLGEIWPQNSGKMNWEYFVAMYNAGYEAAKSVFPNIIAMPHLNNAYQDNTWWFDAFKSAGGKFDMIALSHYPQAEQQMTPEQYNSQAVNNIAQLASRYKVKVMVSEVGVKSQLSESVAASVLSSFISQIKSITQCAGVFYWEPEVYGYWKPKIYNSLGWNAYDQGAFTSDGRPSQVMNCFKE